MKDNQNKFWRRHSMFPERKSLKNEGLIIKNSLLDQVLNYMIIKLNKPYEEYGLIISMLKCEYLIVKNNLFHLPIFFSVFLNIFTFYF